MRIYDENRDFEEKCRKKSWIEIRCSYIKTQKGYVLPKFAVSISLSMNVKKLLILLRWVL